MKKQIKTAIITTILVSIIIVSCAFTMPATAEDRGEFYPKLTVIFKIERVDDLWVVYCIDKTQNIWSFYDDENIWKKGDIANLFMWATGENEEEDEIIEVYWEGYTENINLFFQVNGWR